MRFDETLCCPDCKGLLVGLDAEGTPISDGDEAVRYACRACAMEYPVVDRVVDFLPEAVTEKGAGQRVMESDWVVAIYESKWWRANPLFSLFMGIRLEAEMALIQQVTRPGPTDTILDLACGPGLYARAFAEGSPERRVFGLDLSWPMLRYATKKAARLGVENLAFLHGDAHAIPLKDASVDVVNCSGALHLFRDIQRVLGELRRVIKPGGRFSGAMALVRSNPWSRLKAYLDEKFWKIHYFREEEFKDLLDAAGFEPAVHHTRGVWMIASGVRRP
jgi:ubiquinone/menaquinone biosynthesis C-methylase UbiE/uncharacterized protein YbaR (Trm112 family)